MRGKRGLFIWRCLSLAWLAFLVAAYTWPTDILYAITIWPPFVWAGIGVLLALPGIRRFRTRPQMALLVGWLAFWTIFGEERNWVPATFASTPKSATLVVSLNCAGGSIEAAREACSNSPPIVLLQESPSKRELERLAKETYGDRGNVIAGLDASILTSGRILMSFASLSEPNFVAALIKLDNLPPTLVVSLRLQPPVFRLDYWNPDCWRAYAENRRLRRIEFVQLVEFVEDLAPSCLIIGGDYNSPPDSGTFASLAEIAEPATFDSGYTAVNDFPMARIDQVWTKGLTPIGSRATKTEHSDHRKVLLWLKNWDD